VDLPPQSRIFLEGPAGTGKTTAGAARLLRLLEAGIPASEILILLPQRTLGTPYLEALNQPEAFTGGMVSLLTVGGLARRMVELFWPLISAQAGFSRPDEPPTFLTLETAQYYMAHLVRPLLGEGYFESLTIDRNRLYSQILDNLNKAAVVGFPHTEIGERLLAASDAEPSQVRIYQDAQECANRFRGYCLENNLLDFSLQLEVFAHHLWGLPQCRDYLNASYRHLIFDNLEEDTPVAHDLVRDWLPEIDSALLIYDHDAGYRRFLGADPDHACLLKDGCEQHILFEASLVSAPAVQALNLGLGDRINRSRQPLPAEDPRPALLYETHRFFPEMLEWVTGQIASLVYDEGLPPGQIVVMAPFLSDSLRFALANRLEARQIPVRSHRPSRSLREEPPAQCLLTLAAIAHPQWGFTPGKFDLAYALMQAIEGLDLVRAQLLTEIVYHVRQGAPTLSAFDQIIPETQARITYLFGERYDTLRLWLEQYQQDAQDEAHILPLDHFLSRLFGEVLSQPGFGFHASYDAGQVTANLVESIQKFRWVAAPTFGQTDAALGKEYIEMVKDGVIAAQYLSGWQIEAEDAVLLAPAYTFLMNNRPVEVQFWLDVGSRAWADRLEQPLTHPYVLSRAWQPNTQWTAVEEIATSQERLYRLATGLLRRCHSRLYLGLSELGEQGMEQRGPLLLAFQRLLRDLAALEEQS